MIALNSPRWTELTHAYGNASDTPRLIEALEKGDASALDDLYGSICHQRSTYTASFAAVPHLVGCAASSGDAELRAQMLVLIGGIYNGIEAHPGTTPVDVREAYELSIPKARELALSALDDDLDSTTALYLLQAAAGMHGLNGPGHVLEGFATEEFATTCPNCDSELYVWPSPEHDSLDVAAEDPVKVKNTTRTKVIPGPSDQQLASFQWVTAHAKSAAFDDVRRMFSSLFGIAHCPACRFQFDLMQRLEEEFG